MEDNSKYDEIIKNIPELVVSVDKDNKLVLIDKELFHSKFGDFENYIGIYHKITEIRSFVRNNLLSENYLNEEWGGIQNFIKFIDETHEEVVCIIDTLWINKINSYVSSERPIEEKIDHLVSEISDLAGVQFFGGNEFVKRKKYLKTKIDELELKNKYSNIQNANKADSECNLNFSDNSFAERIVFLYELGILGFLEQKIRNEIHYFAPNKLAEILSAFTNIQQSTAQSYLNPIYNKNIDSKNNPLTEKNLQKVNDKLMRIGFINKNQPK